MPSSRFASSDSFCGSQGGSHTRLTSAWPTPGTAPTRNSTSPGMDSATGQCGVVSVMVTTAWASSSISSPYIRPRRSEEHTSELQSLMRTSYAVFCLKKQHHHHHHTQPSYPILTIHTD